jgi:Flp pilus assembly protein TadG
MGGPAARVRGDRGAVAVSVVVVPIFMTVLFTVLQIAIWYHGQSVATAAAQHGLDAARVPSGTTAAGEATVQQFVDQVGGLGVTDVVVERSAEEVSVTVRGEVQSLVPFFSVPVSVTLDAPVERIVE